MAYELEEEHQNLRKTAREFAVNEIAPTASADERARRFPREIITRMGELGFFGCPIAEEFGGNNSGFLAHTVACEEIARVSSSIAVAFNTQSMATARTIAEFGSDEQKRKYIPKLVSAEWLGCFAVTEPEAGSDVSSIKTTAVKEGGHYRLNGNKAWISLAQVSDVGILFAYTNPDKGRHGISAFILDMKAQGVSLSQDQEKLGWRSMPAADIFLDDVEVPIDNLLSKEGQGFEIMMRSFNNIRLTAAARAVGNSQALIDEVVKYANERVQFGQEIGRFQMVQNVVAEMVAKTEAARLLTYRCASQKDGGNLDNTSETSTAKYYAADVASRISDDAFTIMGAYGCAGQYPLGRLLRDAKMHQVINGSPNIHKLIIAKHALGYR
ncbi:MAG: acyl-CoA dehydrogenase family protein [Dehalococcoidia bacterium]